MFDGRISCRQTCSGIRIVQGEHHVLDAEAFLAANANVLDEIADVVEGLEEVYESWEIRNSRTTCVSQGSME